MFLYFTSFLLTPDNTVDKNKYHFKYHPAVQEKASVASRLLLPLISRGESRLFSLLDVSKAPYPRLSRLPPRSLPPSAVLNRRGSLRTRLPASSPTLVSSPPCTQLLAEPPPRGRQPHCQYRLRPRGPRRSLGGVLPLERAFSASCLLLCPRRPPSIRSPHQIRRRPPGLTSLIPLSTFR